jgi:phage-related protein
VRAIEIEIAGAKDTLATKHDVLALHQASDVTRAELRAEMKALAAELRAEMKQLSAELRGEMAKLAADLRAEMAKELGELRREISGVTRQMYVALLGQTAVLLGFFYFFIAEMR